MALPFHLVFLLCLTSGLLISGTWSANIEPRSRPCPLGWSAVGNRCFILQYDYRRQHEAEDKCRDLGGELASIHNQRENNLARELIHRRFHKDVEAWIGLTDQPTDGMWEWTDGSSVDFTAWYSGEPNNFGGEEDCVSIKHPAGTGWNDDHCMKHLPYVCSLDK